MLKFLNRIFRSANTGNFGDRGEDIAARYLKKKGYRILMRNFDSGSCEIDIVALDGDTLVFVEVKTRQSEDYARPEAQVDRKKQFQITRAAKVYLSHYDTPPRVRFDVVAIVWDEAGEPEIRHHEAAFEAAF